MLPAAKVQRETLVPPCVLALCRDIGATAGAANFEAVAGADLRLELVVAPSVTPLSRQRSLRAVPEIVIILSKLNF
jgi:hypothetical protein